MALKTPCIVCTKDFPTRKGKLYCSDSCKTKASRLRKNGEGEKLESKGRVFYYSDYFQTFQYLDDLNRPDISEFCFAIKNLPVDSPIDFIESTAYGMLMTKGGWKNKIHDRSHLLGKEFEQFQLAFSKGLYQLVQQRPVK